MTLRPPNDSVFQVSLTELAFVLTFAVLLLMGSAFVLKEKGCRKEIDACESARSACEHDKNSCYAKLPAVLGDPKQAIDSLVNEPKLRAENEDLKKRLSTKEAELQAYE